MTHPIRSFFLQLGTALLMSCVWWPYGAIGQSKPDRPNIVLIITDDQGYGDIGAHGNTMIQTPHLNQLYSESVRLTNYHVDPTCSPTRSALMTGRYSSRTGVWHTIMGRSIMASDEVTIAESLKLNGYHTAHFGKWHLGDNAPCRPQDQGFDWVLSHGGGGVGQTPDYYGNTYTNDTYSENGEPRNFSGYCTDIWFREAIRHIRQLPKQQPFFVYLATNAPHGPYRVPREFSQPYLDRGVPSPMAEFYGMITNIDHNLGQFRAELNAMGHSDNTVFIFTTDNGTAAGIQNRPNPQNPDAWKGFNAYQRGTKGSEYDGGHRVPFFISCPSLGISGGRDIPFLTAHIDIHPTLAELAGVRIPPGTDPDGISLVPWLTQPDTEPGILNERIITVHSQRIEYPEKWKTSAVMTPTWRFVNGKELYDMVQDPGQTTNVASANPAVVAKLSHAYEAWWQRISDRFDQPVRISLGHPDEPTAILTAHDWHPDPGSGIPWNQSHIESMPRNNGHWKVFIEEDGNYEFILRHKPGQLRFPIQATDAELTIGRIHASAPVPPGATGIRFALNLKMGPADLQSSFLDGKESPRGAFFMEVRKL